MSPTDGRGHFVVTANHPQSSRGTKTVEGAAQCVEVAVVVEVVRFDVGDHGDLRLESEEAAVALVGLDHQPLAVVPHRVGPDPTQVTPDDEGGVHLGLDQDESQH